MNIMSNIYAIDRGSLFLKLLSVTSVILLLSIHAGQCDAQLDQLAETIESIVTETSEVISAALSADAFDGIPSGAQDVTVSTDGLVEEYFVETKPKLRYWPTRTIGVSMDKSLSPEDSETIWTALKELSKVLNDCITFVERRGKEKDYLNFKKGKTCDSNIGYTGGKHKVRLSTGCLYPDELGAIQHEVLHALGFYHEHSRDDRDGFVEINWDNVPSKEKKDFNKFKFKTFDLPYDHTSVMHYASDAYAINEAIPTIKPSNPAINVTTMGQRVGLATTDVKRTRTAYKCDMLAADYQKTNENNEEGTMTIEVQEIS